jgi:hypothetical protein
VSNVIVPGLIDTAVMMAWVRGHAAAMPFFLAINRLGGPQLSRVTAIDVLRECQSDAERSLTLRFIGYSRVLDLTDPSRAAPSTSSPRSRSRPP